VGRHTCAAGPGQMGSGAGESLGCQVQKPVIFLFESEMKSETETGLLLYQLTISH
jgi:hypothetical protein